MLRIQVRHSDDFLETIYSCGHKLRFIPSSSSTVVQVFEQAAQRSKPSCSYKVQVIFSLHCFTRRADKSGDLISTLVVGGSANEPYLASREWKTLKYIQNSLQAFIYPKHFTYPNEAVEKPSTNFSMILIRKI